MFASRQLELCAIFLAIVLSDAEYCPGQAIEKKSLGEVQKVETKAENAVLPRVLENMPLNSDKRCVGIVSVTEALLDGELDDESANTSIASLAKNIFRNLSHDHPIVYPAQIDIDAKLTNISHPKALNALSEYVADLYKVETKKLSRTPLGAKRLSVARKSVIRTKQELLRLLAADADSFAFLCCFGSRLFPDGSYRETNHAVLFHKTEQGPVVVYDPNDPGKTIPCRLRENASGLTAEWSCAYRDTGLITTQYYQLVPSGRFFRTARGIR